MKTILALIAATFLLTACMAPVSCVQNGHNWCASSVSGGESSGTQ